MPQATDELRNKMRERFGSIDTLGPENYLIQHGFTLSRDWMWSKPGVSSLMVITQEEYDCILFLHTEWDYGGLKECTPGHENNR